MLSDYIEMYIKGIVPYNGKIWRFGEFYRRSPNHSFPADAIAVWLKWLIHQNNTLLVKFSCYTVIIFHSNEQNLKLDSP